MGQSQVSFSLERYTPESEVVTRAGKPVRILEIIRHKLYPVVGVVIGDFEDKPCVWTSSGMFQSYRATHLDLFIKVNDNV